MKNGILRSIFSLTGIIIVAKLLGFVKQLVVANAFGTTLETDLINLAQSCITSIQGPVIDALPTAFVSVYLAIPAQDEGKRQTFFGLSGKLAFLFGLLISVLIYVIAPLLSNLIGSTYSGELSQKLTGYLKLYSPLTVCVALQAVFVATLNANQCFVKAELRSVMQSLILIASVLLFQRSLGVDTISWGFIAYNVINVLMLGAFSLRFFGRTRGRPLRDESVRAMLRMMGPLLLGYAMIYINSLVDQSVASGLEEGSVSAMSYAWVLTCLITSFITMFCTVLFTHVAGNVSAGNHQTAAQLSVRAARIMTLVFLPISIIAILSARDVVSIVYQRGAYGEESVRLTASSLCGYCLTFVPYVIRELFARLQYAYQQSKRPMINSGISIVLNIILSILLSRFWGVFGISIASSISVILCAVLNYFSAKKCNGYISLRGSAKDYLLMTVGGLVCVAAVLVGKRILVDFIPLVRFAMITVGAGGLYCLVVLPVVLRFLREKKQTPGSETAENNPE